MITVSNLNQSFGKKLILESINIEINKHEICALVGRNGAGKSTFINSLLGLLPVKQGTISINGGQVTKKNHDWKKAIAYLPEKFQLYPMLTGLENITFFAEAACKKVEQDRIESVLKSVSLWEDRSVQVKKYSKGMLQRLGLAITLYQDSSILILDEPTSGIDPMGRKEILEVLKSLHDKTILLSSHHLDEIKQVCTHVAYLNNGKMEKYTVEEFLQTHNLGGIES
ncbi:ABC transporter ATP-binding protein [Bacillus sp. EB106-08-02-XG196]|uniref:ABC transporter ATP-binding protein n=1 Tax=Bacillus sp. EB106-08-02-XG196 TaxID=2737049 RepID=UPI0015C4C6A4|nr:ABC transporter ATP-binding protein [Bacillus sp. EB106-08-02-XG196]NWQ40896.1 ABC transporter ATP-binding protein [Bacillus sp. EB106-08-02-XG196]